VSHLLEREMELALPRERVFAFFSDAFNLEQITPPELRFRVTTPAPIELEAGAHIHYRLALYGIPFDWETRISRWDPPCAFADEQVRGPYRRWVHLHEFEERATGTRIRDCVEYGLPFGWIGACAHPLVRRQLDRIFDFRQRTIAHLLGGAGRATQAERPRAGGR